MESFSDEQLIEKVLDGDQLAFERLVNRYKDFVFTLCSRILKNESLAEEVAQDVFLSAHKGLAGFKRKSKFATWLYRIAYNLALNASRKQATERRIFRDMSTGAEDMLRMNDTETTSPLLEMERSDLARIVEEALERIPARYGVIITMYHMKQLNYDEIADITELPIGTVKSHLYRGRAILKEEISKYYRKEELL